MAKRRRTWAICNVLARDTREALSDFRTRTAIHGRRLTVLRDYAEVWLVCASLPGSYAIAKHSATETRRAWHAKHRGARCFTDCGRLAQHAHHVIQLQHGGADIPENKVPLCDICHAEVHPWMPADETPIDPVHLPIWSRPEPLKLKAPAERPRADMRRWHRGKAQVQPMPPLHTPKQLRKRAYRKLVQAGGAVGQPRNMTPRLVK